MKKTFSTYPKNTQIGVCIIWLFNITALVGIAFGFQDWFMEKTIINMCIYTLLLSLLLPIKSAFQWAAFFSCFLVGMTSEWIGVHTSWLYGNYYYGENLGFKWLDVPIFIGMNWAVLSIVSADTAKAVVKNKHARAITAATLMVLLDILMEIAAPKLDFWYFIGGNAPLKNYISWFFVALLIQYTIIPKLKGSNTPFSMHLLGSQFVFFIVYLLIQ
jgi:putative membrane protein